MLEVLNCYGFLCGFEVAAVVTACIVCVAITVRALIAAECEMSIMSAAVVDLVPFLVAVGFFVKCAWLLIGCGWLLKQNNIVDGEFLYYPTLVGRIAGSMFAGSMVVCIATLCRLLLRAKPKGSGSHEGHVF